jgi:hypothetical protein
MKFNTACFVLVFLFISGIISAGYIRAEESGALPKAVIEQTSFEFSPVIAGSDVTHVFKIQNTGTANLNIPGIYTE